jgi:hypothetical protein
MIIRIDKKRLTSVFILEDDQHRIDWFNEKFGDVPFLFITKDTKLAIMLLRLIPFDLIFLDHDLEETSIYDMDHADYDETCGNNGLRVAAEIQYTINQETSCIIHSMNPTGAGNMVKAHPFNVSAIPFHILYKDMEFCK